MKSTIAVAASLSLLLVGCAGTSDQSDMVKVAGTGDEASDVQVAKADDPNELVCKRVEVTGSRFSKKICMTRKQIEDQRRGAQSGVQAFQNRANQTNNPTGQ